MQELGTTDAKALNASGVVTGGVTTPSGQRAFRVVPVDTNGDGQRDTWYRDAHADSQNDLLQVLTHPSGYSLTRAWGVNSQGEAAGETWGPQLAIFWDSSGAAEVPATKPGGAAWGGLNDSGVLAGWSAGKNGQGMYPTTRAKTVSRKGTTWTLTTLTVPSPYTEGLYWDINNGGAASGRIWKPGQVNISPAVWCPAAGGGLPAGWKVLESLSGSPSGDARALNELRQLAGSTVSAQAGDGQHPVLWLPAPAFGLPAGVRDLLPAGAGLREGQANGLGNAPGGVLHVVGAMDDLSSTALGFVWDSASQQTRDLNQVTSGIPAGYVIGEAKAINDSGCILANVATPGIAGQHSVILVPNG